MKIALAQINVTVGSLVENGEKIAEYISKARDAGADLVAFPELVVTGYPIYDLIYEEGFVRENMRVLEEIIAPATTGVTAVVGFIGADIDRHDEEGEAWRANCAAVISDGKISAVVKKTLLPGYDVFDEKRYFAPGAIEDIAPVEIPMRGGGTTRLGVEICEDLWSEPYGLSVSRLLVERGATLALNISASPYCIGKPADRMARARKERCGVPFIYMNMVGGQDEIVFDGGSFALDADGRLAAQAAMFEEDFVLFELDEKGRAAVEVAPPEIPWEEQIVRAQALNLHDYFFKQKCFDGVVVGNSGGVDSAYTLYIAVRALGQERVLSVAMPSRFSSDHSKSDAALLAENLGIRHKEIPIESMFEAGLTTFEQAFGPTPFGLAEENDQARCRMRILMKISQKFKYLVCTTGNKSELSVGYWTLYGDGGGGKNVPGDLFKTELYKVARHINRDREIIPWNTINKPPSAELAPNQKDTDSLPEYELLDGILRMLVEERRNPEEIVRAGFDAQTVARVVRMYKIGEFKRGQMPQGIKVKKKSFGSGRRMPITNRWL